MNVRDFQKILVEMVASLSETVDARDRYTLNHSKKVTKISMAIAAQMGMELRMLEQIKVGGLLHDIGKLGISDKILRKPSALTRKEYGSIKKHSEIGSKIVGPISRFCEIKEIILHHHERYDGRGYPSGFKKEHIPIGARIMAVADSYDAITSCRPYRRARSHKYAVAEIVKAGKTQFDPGVVEAFLQVENSLFKDKLIGTFLLPV